MAVSRQNRYRQAGVNRMYKERYVYGNAVRQPKELPEKEPARWTSPKRASVQVRKNRRRALDMSPAYAAFLIAASVCAVLVCFAYLKLQSEIINKSENINALQEELAELTEQNDMAYNAVIDSVNLEEIRDRALNELGMVYACEGQVVEYQSPTREYVKQYSDIPTNGILAKSKNATD